MISDYKATCQSISRGHRVEHTEWKSNNAVWWACDFSVKPKVKKKSYGQTACYYTTSYGYEGVRRMCLWHYPPEYHECPWCLCEKGETEGCEWTNTPSTLIISEIIRHSISGLLCGSGLHIALTNIGAFRASHWSRRPATKSTIRKHGNQGLSTWQKERGKKYNEFASYQYS